MPSHLARLVAVLGLCLMVAGAWPAAQIPAIPSARMSSGGSTMLSPSVIGTYQFSPGAADLLKLEALVLFRGRPGWYSQRGSSTSASTSGGGSMIGGSSGWSSVTRFGNVELTLRGEPEKSLLVIQGRPVDTREGNVVMVDGIDDPSGPVIVDMLRIEAQIPFVSGPDVLLPILNAAPEIKPFLRCDVAGPWPVPPTMNVCGRVTP